MLNSDSMQKLKQNRIKLENDINKLINDFHLKNNLIDGEMLEVHVNYTFTTNTDTNISLMSGINTNITILI